MNWNERYATETQESFEEAWDPTGETKPTSVKDLVGEFCNACGARLSEKIGKHCDQCGHDLRHQVI